MHQIRNHEKTSKRTKYQFDLTLDLPISFLRWKRHDDAVALSDIASITRITLKAVIFHTTATSTRVYRRTVIAGRRKTLVDFDNFSEHLIVV